MPDSHQVSTAGSSCPAVSRLVKLPLASVMRSHSPSYLVCTPREKGTTTHAPLRFTGSFPLLAIRPMTSASTALKGSAFPPSFPRHCRGGLRKSAAACPGGAHESTSSGSPGRHVQGIAPSSIEALTEAQPRPAEGKVGVSGRGDCWRRRRWWWWKSGGGGGRRRKRRKRTPLCAHRASGAGSRCTCRRRSCWR